MTRRRQNLAWGIGAVFLFGASWFILTGFNPFGSRILAFGDLLNYFVPLWQAFRKSLLHGDLPLWESAMVFGFPLFENPQVGLFHLPNYLLLLPEPFCYSVYIILPYLIHCIGAFYLLRSSGWKSPESAFAACGISLCGLLLAVHSMPTASWTLAWWPVIHQIWSRDRASRTSLLIAAFLLAQSFLAGAWDIWIPVCLAFLAWNARQLRRRDWWMAQAFFLVLVLPQVVYSMDILSWGRRASGLLLDEALLWSTGLMEVLGMIAPRIQIHGVGPQAWVTFWGERQSWLLSSYSFALLSALLPFLLAWFFRRRPLAGALLVALAILSAAPLFRDVATFLWNHGFKPPFRYPEKLLLAALYFAALQMCLEFDPLALSLGRLRPRARWLLAVLGGGWILLVVWGFPHLLQDLIGGFTVRNFGHKGLETKFVDYYREIAGIDLRTWIGFAVAGVGILLLPLPGQLRRFAFAAILFLDTLMAGANWNSNMSIPFGKDVVAQQTTAVPQAHFSMSLGALSESGDRTALSNLIRLDCPPSTCRTDSSNLYSRIYKNPMEARRIGLIWLDYINVFPGQGAIALLNQTGVSPGSDREIFWRAGVKTLIFSWRRPAQWRNFDFSRCLLAKDSLTVACDFADNPGLVRFHTLAFTFPSDTASLKSMLGIGHNRDAVYLTDPDAPDPKYLRIDGARNRKAELVAWQGTYRKVRLTGEGSGWLVLAQAFHPRWKAFVDGKPVPTHRADVALTSVLVPSDGREIEFRFSPPWHFWGLGIGWVVLVLGLLAAAAWRGRGRIRMAVRARSITPADVHP